MRQFFIIVIFSICLNAYSQNSYDSYYTNGEKYMQNGDCFQALTWFEKAYKINSDHANLCSNIGICFYKLGNMERAIHFFRKTIDVDSLFFTAYCGLADAYINTSIDSSFAVINRAIKLILNNEQSVKNNFTVLYSNPIALCYYNRANYYLKINNYNESMKDFNKSIELNPSNPIAFYSRGVLNYNLNNLNEACKDWQKAADLGDLEAGKLILQYCK